MRILFDGFRELRSNEEIRFYFIPLTPLGLYTIYVFYFIIYV